MTLAVCSAGYFPKEFPWHRIFHNGYFYTRTDALNVLLVMFWRGCIREGSCLPDSILLATWQEVWKVTDQDT